MSRSRRMRSGHNLFPLTPWKERTHNRKTCDACQNNLHHRSHVGIDAAKEEIRDMAINEFDGSYRWLSNFWECDVPYNGHTYISSEHAYQAAKTTNEKDRLRIANCRTPGETKRLIRTLDQTPGFHERKLQIMEDIVRSKFTHNADLAEKLVETEGDTLVEGNSWKDTFWGVCCGKGENHLGKILMKIREELLGDVVE